VVWQRIKDLPSSEQIQGVITALQPRKNMLARPDFTGQMKPVAANIDQILIVTSPVPELNEGLVDRYLVAAELSGISAVLVLNKIDILTEEQKNQLTQRISVYQETGYSVIYTSAKTQHGLDSLYQQLSNKSSVFVGQSGVGKSSLINALLPEAQIKEGEVSESTHKGIHTTSVSRLYHLDNEQVKNAIVIDSPGIREFGLWNIDKNEVIHGFRELEQYAQYCRFRDCKHLNEPGCGVLKAVEEGKISAQRFESYHRIMESLD
jgi:ribosome biogenesis GTPase